MSGIAATAAGRNLRFAVLTEELVATGPDAANRAAVKARAREELAVAGLAWREDRKVMNKVLKGLSPHR